MQARRRANLEIAGFMLNVVNTSRIRKSDKTLSPDMAMAIVGGINEPALQAIEDGRVAGLQNLMAPSVALVKAVA